MYGSSLENDLPSRCFFKLGSVDRHIIYRALQYCNTAAPYLLSPCMPVILSVVCLFRANYSKLEQQYVNNSCYMAKTMSYNFSVK